MVNQSAKAAPWAKVAAQPPARVVNPGVASPPVSAVGAVAAVSAGAVAVSTARASAPAPAASAASAVSSPAARPGSAPSVAEAEKDEDDGGGWVAAGAKKKGKKSHPVLVGDAARGVSDTAAARGTGGSVAAAGAVGDKSGDRSAVSKPEPASTKSGPAGPAQAEPVVDSRSFPPPSASLKASPQRRPAAAGSLSGPPAVSATLSGGASSKKHSPAASAKFPAPVVAGAPTADSVAQPPVLNSQVASAQPGSTQTQSGSAQNPQTGPSKGPAAGPAHRTAQHLAAPGPAPSEHAAKTSGPSARGGSLDMPPGGNPAFRISPKQSPKLSHAQPAVSASAAALFGGSVWTAAAASRSGLKQKAPGNLGGGGGKEDFPDLASLAGSFQATRGGSGHDLDEFPGLGASVLGGSNSGPNSAWGPSAALVRAASPVGAAAAAAAVGSGAGHSRAGPLVSNADGGKGGSGAAAVVGAGSTAAAAPAGAPAAGAKGPQDSQQDAFPSLGASLGPATAPSLRRRDRGRSGDCGSAAAHLVVPTNSSEKVNLEKNADPQKLKKSTSTGTNSSSVGSSSLRNSPNLAPSTKSSPLLASRRPGAGIVSGTVLTVPASVSPAKATGNASRSQSAAGAGPTSSARVSLASVNLDVSGVIAPSAPERARGPGTSQGPSGTAPEQPGQPGERGTAGSRQNSTGAAAPAPATGGPEPPKPKGPTPAPWSTSRSPALQSAVPRTSGPEAVTIVLPTGETRVSTAGGNASGGGAAVSSALADEKPASGGSSATSEQGAAAASEKAQKTFAPPSRGPPGGSSSSGPVAKNPEAWPAPSNVKDVSARGSKVTGTGTPTLVPPYSAVADSSGAAGRPPSRGASRGTARNLKEEDWPELGDIRASKGGVISEDGDAKSRRESKASGGGKTQIILRGLSVDKEAVDRKSACAYVGESHGSDAVRSSSCAQEIAGRDTDRGPSTVAQGGVADSGPTAVAPDSGTGASSPTSKMQGLASPKYAGTEEGGSELKFDDLTPTTNATQQRPDDRAAAPSLFAAVASDTATTGTASHTASQAVITTFGDSQPLLSGSLGGFESPLGGAGLNGAENSTAGVFPIGSGGPGEQFLASGGSTSGTAPDSASPGLVGGVVPLVPAQQALGQAQASASAVEGRAQEHTETFTHRLKLRPALSFVDVKQRPPGYPATYVTRTSSVGGLSGGLSGMKEKLLGDHKYFLIAIDFLCSDSRVA